MSLSLSIYIYVYVYIYSYIYIHIHIMTEGLPRAPLLEGEGEALLRDLGAAHVYVYVYICV